VSIIVIHIGGDVGGDGEYRTDATTDETGRPVSVSSVSQPAECFVQSAQVKASAGSISAYFTPKMRLALCANAPSAAGPVDCAR
jgi:hypothetical protein